ncbi:TIGR02444 family protein [Shewanella sedimentimangrovi]|uniref:TIGR02444 family protein n=1 Tax=Shewanella sedimentimangrovi TaxID=2814293 RepID=A0ABX7R0L1_9GAMM|nr:TIGR02444 family protein [Shewanella sedimentimangrovi]QSX36615.1 TIGR02444 family protein [Shewanella sedimentimangrovi]
MDCEGVWPSCEQRYHRHSALCLALQDEHGVNVNLLLLAAELDARELALTQQDWQGLLDEARQWDERLIAPFRRLRRLAKPNLEPAEYQQMLDVELMMERKVQHLLRCRLEQLTASEFPADSSPANNPADHPVSNLCLYLGLFGLTADRAAALRD